MFRWIVVLALAGFTTGCAQPHCADQQPQVGPEIQDAAFPQPVKMRGATREFLVFRRGSGPPVVVFHELPGLSPATFRLAHRISEAGFTVYVPLLFGRPGEFAPRKNLLLHITAAMNAAHATTNLECGNASYRSYCFYSS